MLWRLAYVPDLRFGTAGDSSLDACGNGEAAILLRSRPARRRLVPGYPRRGLKRAKNGLLSADRS
jgi:hypothetical protein